MSKEMLSPNFVIIERKLTEVDKLTCFRGYRVSAHGVLIPNFNLVTFIIFELSTLMSSKWRHYTPESRFRTVNPET